MTSLLNFILWNPDTTALHLGPFDVRWYGLCWLTGLALAYFLVRWLYHDQRVKDEYFDPLFLYCFAGILVGARLGHCIFYEPHYFLTSWQHVIEMLLPIRFVDGAPLAHGGMLYSLTGGTVIFTGYEGLASHGGTLGLMLALWCYYRRTHMNLWQVLDDIAIATPVTACLIRLGNLMNSEILGRVTDLPWGFYFVQAGPEMAAQPRHPGQLYEAIAYFIFFFVGWWLYRKHPQRVGSGYFFGLCLTLIFTFRFFIEFTKDIQVSFESSMPLDMGQILSIPFVVLGAWCMRRGLKAGK